MRDLNVVLGGLLMFVGVTNVIMAWTLGPKLITNSQTRRLFSYGSGALFFIGASLFMRKIVIF
jgi:hypothetical protein